ncbi:MAG: flagellar export chaperone FliS [Oscillospiraceae bacterium]
MNYNNLRQEYLKQSVMTASPAELIVMLFESCIKNLKLAEICLNDKKDIERSNEHFIKAQKIIMELVNCLDTSFEISKDLLSIYDFLLYSIRVMNIKKDLSQLPGVLEILDSLRNTWEQIARPNCDIKVC